MIVNNFKYLQKVIIFTKKSKLKHTNV